MAHISIEYSANVDTDVDMQRFCQVLLEAAAAIDTFPTPGLRVRAVKVDYYAIADGNPAHGFIDIGVRLRGGRPLDVRKAAVDTLFDAAKQYLAPTMATRSLALSMEMRDIDPELSPKIGTTRDHLENK